jgi:hydroxymethylbilane synthase
LVVAVSALVNSCFRADFSPARPVRAGTRGSPLARQQTQLVVSALSAAWPGFSWSEEVIITSGDRVTDRPLTEVGGKGLFAKEIDAALLAGRVDFAVHSLKDLETELPAGIVLACTLPRADPRDALVIDPRNPFDERWIAFPMLPAGARIGTASARRQAQLLHVRPDLRIQLIRGNVQGRLNRVEEGDFVATLLAVAGLERLGLICRIDSPGGMHRIQRLHSGPGIVVLAPETMVPAAGQGIIAVTARADDRRMLSLLAAINDRATWAAARAERAVLRALDGNCRTPIGAYGRVLPNSELLLTAMTARADGSFLIKRWRHGPAAEADALGAELGASLRRMSPQDLFQEQLPARAGAEA